MTADDLTVERGTITFAVAPQPIRPSPAPPPSASGGPTTATGGASDVLLAPVVAAVVIGGIAIYLFRKPRW